MDSGHSSQLVRSDVESRTWEVGYWIAKDHWGKGVATAAIKGFTRWAFTTFPDILRFEAKVYEGNKGSMKVLERIGFTKEGIRRQSVFKHGKVMDTHIFGLLREDIETLQ